ncbi:MAG: hypothetical protein HYY18_10315 [Planctomycetes bacterium]|nr:hypothetical protein [Planctomycetota bacterium]
MTRALALALLLPLAAFAEDAPAKKLKTDSPIRQKRVKEFLSGDAEKKTLAMAEAAKWLTVPAAAASKELDMLRRHVPARGLFKDPKGQPLLRGLEKYKVGGKEFEYQWAVPKDYNPAKPTPLLIYLHGSNGPQGIGPWDGWAASKGAILVAPASPNRQYWHPVDGATDPKEYEETFFFTHMKAWREKFNLDWNRICLSGFSAGGFGSWWFSLRYPDWWAAVMPMAGGPPANWGERGPYEHVGKLPYWVWHGELDKDVPVDIDRKGVEWLKKIGTPCEYKEYEGGDHNTWFGKDPEIAKTVLKVIEGQRRIVWPKKVVWTWDQLFLKTFPGITRVAGAWWLEMGEHGERARLEGEITAPNVVELRVKDVKSARVLVFADLFDLAKPIEVKWEGATVFNGVVEVDFEMMLREFAARPDPNRIVVGEILVNAPAGK